MIRPRVIRALLSKEALRCRHNWGSLIVVIALIGLAALISLGRGTRFLPGQAQAGARRCTVLHDRGSEWAAHLQENPPAGDFEIQYVSFDARRGVPRID